jgi:hypothetical protein
VLPTWRPCFSIRTQPPDVHCAPTRRGSSIPNYLSGSLIRRAHSCLNSWSRDGRHRAIPRYFASGAAKQCVCADYLLATRLALLAALAQAVLAPNGCSSTSALGGHSDRETTDRGVTGTTMMRLRLERRKWVLKQLGLEASVSRSSWSHDLGESMVFDALEHHWKRDGQGNLARYALRTSGAHYNRAESRRNPRRGHTRWQDHVDLVLAGKRKPFSIVPVANDPMAKPNKGAKGWLPGVVEGRVEIDDSGDVWLCADQTIGS